MVEIFLARTRQMDALGQERLKAPLIKSPAQWPGTSRCCTSSGRCAIRNCSGTHVRLAAGVRRRPRVGLLGPIGSASVGGAVSRRNLAGHLAAQGRGTAAQALGDGSHALAILNLDLDNGAFFRSQMVGMIGHADTLLVSGCRTRKLSLSSFRTSFIHHDGPGTACGIDHLNPTDSAECRRAHLAPPIKNQS